MSDAPHASTARDYDQQTSNAKREQTIGVLAGAGGAVVTALAVWRFISVAGKPVRDKRAFRVLPARDGVFASYFARF